VTPRASLEGRTVDGGSAHADGGQRLVTDEELIDHLRLAARLSDIEVQRVMCPREGETIAHHLRLHHLEWSASGPPVVFLHGGGLTAHSWDLVCLSLRTRYRCLALDQRGHGDSEWSPDANYQMDVQARDIEAWVDELGLERFVLVGHSMGGINALYLAGECSERVSGLVLVDTAPVGRWTKGQNRLLGVMGQGEALESVDAFVAQAMAQNPARRAELLRTTLALNLRPLPDGRVTWKYDPRRYARENLERELGRHGELWERMHLVRCPVLVVRGARSDVLTRGDFDRLMSSLDAATGVEVADAGHTTHGHNPRAFIEAVRAFLESLPGRKASALCRGVTHGHV
jgi:esterase